MIGDFFFTEKQRHSWALDAQCSPDKLFWGDILNIFDMLSFSVHTDTLEAYLF